MNKGGIRTQAQLVLMRKSGWITACALKEVLTKADVGVSLLELEEVATTEILKLGGQPAFKTVPGYHWTTCLTVNDEVVHGIPRDIKLKNGDILSVDLGAIYHGWYTDAAWSKIIGEETPPKREFLDVGEEALWEAIKQAVGEQKIGDISSAIQKRVEGGGYSIVKSLSGHGVGKSYHEQPEIPGFGVAGKGLNLKTGMTLAIEAIYAVDRGDVYEKDDGWTIATVDGSLSGLFEMTVVVGQEKPEVLTDWRKIS